MIWVGLLGLLLGAALGGAIGYLWADRKCRREQTDLQTAVATGEQRLSDLTAQLSRELSNTQSLREQLSTAECDAATLRAKLESAEKSIAEQKRLLDDAQLKLRDAFATVSAEALAKNNEAFLHLAKERFATLSTEATGSLEQRKAQIEGLLKPMQELLNTYQTRLADIEKSRLESYSMLREQLGVLAETQRTLNTQTSQLVSALRRPQTRGQWGEITLKRLVELAGMSSRCDFFEQASVDGEEGKLRPDVVVKLPGGREIIVDCKAALDAFLDAAGAADEDQRKVHLLRHAQQVRSRARELSAKSYWSQFARSPEYVVMFLPGEAFLYAAVEQDGTLIEDCLKSRVIVATPTTLIALLKAIEYGWRQEDMTENAERIRKIGAELYERITVLTNHIEKLGDAIGATVTHYNAAIGSLESRVLVSARKMGELGAKSGKEIPELDRVETTPREMTESVLALPEQS